MATDVTTETQLSVDRPGGRRARVACDQIVAVEGWAWSPDGPAGPDRDDRRSPRRGARPAGWRTDVSAALGHRRDPRLRRDGHPCGPAAGAGRGRRRPREGRRDRGRARAARVEVARPGSRHGGGRPRPWAGFAERLDPQITPGGLTHAEHVARYRWAAQLAEGRDVLDAALRGRLRRAHPARRRRGAPSPGSTRSPPRSSRRASRARDGLRFELGDLRDLPFEPASFDLVVCFEAIEHVGRAGARARRDQARAAPRRACSRSPPPCPAASPCTTRITSPSSTPDEFEACSQRSPTSSCAGSTRRSPRHRRRPVERHARPPLAAARPGPPGRSTRCTPSRSRATPSSPDPRRLGALAAGYDIGALVSQPTRCATTLPRNAPRRRASGPARSAPSGQRGARRRAAGAGRADAIRAESIRAQAANQACTPPGGAARRRVRARGARRAGGAGRPGDRRVAVLAADGAAAGGRGAVARHRARPGAMSATRTMRTPPPRSPRRGGRAGRRDRPASRWHAST